MFTEEELEIVSILSQRIHDLHESIQILDVSIRFHSKNKNPVDFKPLVSCLAAFALAQRECTEELTLSLRDLVEIIKTRDLPSSDPKEK